MIRERKQAYLALLFTAIIWGIAPPVIKHTLSFITPVSFLFFRFLLAFTIIAIPFAVRIKKIKPPKKDLFLYFWLAFLCGPLNLVLLFSGIQKTTAINASLISILSPILIVIGGVFFLKENVSKFEKVGISLAVAGTFLTIIQPIIEANNYPRTNISGNILVLLGTLVWVVFTILSKKNRHLDPFLLTCFSYLIGVVFVLPLFVLEKTPLLTPALPGIIFMALFSSVLAYFFYVFGLSKIEASEATVFTYLQPVFSIPIAILFLNEKISPFFILGAVLIVLGVFICETRITPKH